VKLRGGIHKVSAETKVDKSVDYKGLLCPMPIVKVARAIKEIEVGQVLEMLADDPGSEADVKAWVKQTRHELLDMQREGGVFKFYVRRSS
jgi:tRNA 2-thiouridine synthesizing protein A